MTATRLVHAALAIAVIAFAASFGAAVVFAFKTGQVGAPF
jgi:hypothetical protein